MMQTRKKWMAVLLAISLLCTSIAPVAATGADSSTTEDGDWVYQDTESGLKNYAKYIAQYGNVACPETEIPIDVTNFTVLEPEFGTEASGTDLYHDLKGSATGVYIKAKGEDVVFTVEIPETGLYSVEMKYYPLEESNNHILFGFYVDGELPFIEANNCRLDRVFKNEEVEQDKYGDDLRPQSTQTPYWRTQLLKEQTGVYGVMQFYLEAGIHEIGLCFDGTPILLEGMTLKQEEYLISYQDYISLYRQKGYKDTVNVLELFEAENYLEQSSSTLWPDYDKTSPLTSPFSYKNNKLNYGGGEQWVEPGQWISWKVTAPEDGFYNIGFKYKQGYLDGLFSSRKVYIDGEVPFQELTSVKFAYSAQWKNFYLQNESGPYSIFLTKGDHVITMENVIGDLSHTMGTLQTTIDELNNLYLSIIMITSSEPDTYRDYYLEKQLPNLPADLMRNAERLAAEAKWLQEMVGAKGAENAYFEDVAYNLQSYAENIVDLTYKQRLTNLKNDISGLSSKLQEYQKQALDIDYIALTSADVEMPKATPNFWQWLVYQVRSFIESFRTNRYDNEEDTESIRVWVNTGMDQYQIIQNMITDVFTPQYGIKVDLKLVQGSLIEAKVSGNGPDVQIGSDSSAVVNLGLRGALVDLSEFEGFWDVMDQYMEGSEVPFRLEGKYFGMPNTNAFNVMFVRTDIFERMGLKVPSTWDEMYDVAQVLQRYNMSLGSAASFQTLLYQNGGSYYNEDLTEVLFREDVAVNALTQHAEFYTKYGFPISFDFTSRFRTGEMPIAIAPYNTYNTLKYSAPEISGLWKMFIMPGTQHKDGSVNYTQVDNTLGGTIMLESAKNKDACWTFIKWWSEAEAQTRYALDVEAALGVASRATPANLITLKQLGWTSEELAVLEEQAKYIEFIPIVPGDYYVTRGLSNATRGVIYDGGNPRELLTEWTIKINDELRRKRLEFQKNN